LKKIILAFITAVIFSNPGALLAQDFDKGWAAYKAGDFATALKEWQPLAEQGDAGAQTMLGRLYHIGKGVLQDYKIAMKWYKLAAKQGEDFAPLYLSFMYINGEGVPRDIKKSVKWYKLEAERNLVIDLYVNTMKFDEAKYYDVYKVAKWYRLAAKQGNAYAQGYLGDMYDAGQGVPQDYIRAYMWLNIAGANGYERASGKRDAVAKKLMQTDISKAQQLSRACLAQNYKNCGY